uniref:Uncharacterized protein n=1 Tax=Leersia perrieri TaxID=77586 RepID=A0A0D9W8Z1_9ORYZ
MSSRMAGSVLLRQLGSRLFAAEPVYSGLAAARIFPARMASTSAAGADAKKDAAAAAEKPSVSADQQQNNKAIVSYWGIQPPKLVKEDGTEWKWLSFRPWDTYTSDTSIDVTKHHVPKSLPDKLAYGMVKSLCVPRDLFFQRRHASHALLLETKA